MWLLWCCVVLVEKDISRMPQRDYLISIYVYISIYLSPSRLLSLVSQNRCIGRHQCPPKASLSISYPLSLSRFSLRCSSPEPTTSNNMRQCLIPLTIMDPETIKFGPYVTPSSILCHAIVVEMKKTDAFFAGGAGIEGGVESCVGHSYWVSGICFWNRWRGRWGRHFRSHAHPYCRF